MTDNVTRLAEKLYRIGNNCICNHNPCMCQTDIESLLREAMEEVLKEGIDKRGAYEFTKTKAKHTKYFNQGLTRAAEVAREHSCSNWCINRGCVGAIATAIEKMREEK